MKAVLWVPGRFSLTNQMLSNLRAAGSYRGHKPKGWRDLFAEETATIRLAVKVAARGVSGFGLVSVFVTVLGHWKHDPDGWLLLGKAAVDGLVDAGLMMSDRQDLYSLGGRVTATREEDARRWRMLYGPDKSLLGAGFLLEVEGVFESGCGHA
jgi:hypothetical protein